MKRLLLTLMIVGGMSAMNAQVVSDNTFFLQGQVGAAYYNHAGEGSLGLPAAGLNAGWWIARPLATRLGVNMAMAPSAYAPEAGNATFIFAGVDFMWDVNSTFFHVYNKRFLTPIPFYPMMGLGYVNRMEFKVDSTVYPSESGFYAMLGLHIPVRISQFWDAFAEYQCRILPQSFENANGGNQMHYFTLGLSHRWSADPFHRRTAYETRGTTDNWFMGFGVGPNFSSFDFEFIDKFGMYGVTPELMFGRNLSDFWTLRFDLSGLTAHERYDTVQDMAGQTYHFTYLHADLMFNFSHLFNFRRGVRLNFLPYLGAGPIWRYDDITLNFAANAGLFTRYYLNNIGDLFVDLRYTMVGAQMTGSPSPSDNMFGLGYLSLTFGYIHNFGHSNTRYRMPINYSGDRLR